MQRRVSSEGLAQDPVALRAGAHPEALLCFNGLQFERQEVVNIVDANSLRLHTASHEAHQPNADARSQSQAARGLKRALPLLLSVRI